MQLRHMYACVSVTSCLWLMEILYFPTIYVFFAYYYQGRYPHYLMCLWLTSGGLISLIESGQYMVEVIACHVVIVGQSGSILLVYTQHSCWLISVAAFAHGVFFSPMFDVYNCDIALATMAGYGLVGLYHHAVCVLCQSLPVSCGYPTSHMLHSFPWLCNYYSANGCMRMMCTNIQLSQCMVEIICRHPYWLNSHDKWSAFAWLLA